MKKKFFAVALATTMVVSSAMSAMAEDISGTDWWAAGNGKSADYALSGDGSVSLDINCTAANDAGYAAFNVEVYADAWFFTTGSNQDAWWAEGAGEGKDGITGIASELNSTIKAGSTYKVTVTRSGNDITVTYANPDGSEYAKFVGTNASTPNDLKVHVLAQVGSYTITESKKDDAGSTTAADTKKDDATTPSTAAPAAGNDAKKDNAAATTAAASSTTTTKSATKTSPKTGDAAPIAALGAVAVVACAGVVVSRRKVTE